MLYNPEKSASLELRPKNATPPVALSMLSLKQGSPITEPRLRLRHGIGSGQQAEEQLRKNKPRAQFGGFRAAWLFIAVSSKCGTCS